MNYKIVTDPLAINEKDWSEFTYNHPQGNIFQTPEIFHLHDKYLKYEPIIIFALNDENNILGLLQAVIQREHKGIIGGLSSRSIIWGGPLVLDNDPDLLALFLKKYNEIVRKKAIYSQYRNLWDWKDSRKIFKENGYVYEKHLDILFDLAQSEDELLKQMHKQRRHNVRRAKNKGVIFREVTNYEEIKRSYQLVKETYIRVKLPIADELFFYKAFDLLYPKNMIRFFGAYIGDKIIGVRVVLCFKNLVYDWYSGSSYEYKNKYPNDFLPWEVILWSKKNGYKFFDFGGAGKPSIPYGVRDFKKTFGGEFVNFGRFEKIHKPLMVKLAKLAFMLWKIARKKP